MGNNGAEALTGGWGWGLSNIDQSSRTLSSGKRHSTKYFTELYKYVKVKKNLKEITYLIKGTQPPIYFYFEGICMQLVYQLFPILVQTFFPSAKLRQQLRRGLGNIELTQIVIFPRYFKRLRSTLEEFNQTTI